MANTLEGAIGARASALAPSPAREHLVPGRLIATALAALILAGCANRFPAPIVHRAPGTGAVPVERGGPPILVTQPPATSAQSPDMGPASEPVHTAPVRASSIESRPIAGAPISPGMSTSAGGAPVSAVRTEPSAVKRPYSDQLLAQLKNSAPRPESGGAAAVSPAAASSAAASSPATVAAAPGRASARGFIWPASGQVVQRFGASGSSGLVISGNAGDPVFAAADGRVIFSGRGPRGYGNLVIVKHDNDTLSVYGHNRALLVKEGASVTRGQRIAEIGDTDADRPKLHFEIRKDSKPVDPAQFLPAR